MKWRVVYKKAYNDDGTLFFPEKLSHEFLESAKRTMGSYIFANQYLNEIIPADRQTFKKTWFKYYEVLPKKRHTFIFIDPALSEADTADYTGIVVAHVGADGDWYIQYAKRHRFNPTELVEFIFKLNEKFKPNIIGFEEIAFQKAILHFFTEEMRRRKVVVPITGIKYPSNKSKQTRILSLVPRFEWGHIHLAQGLTDLELELLQFPRGGHDDLIDAMASLEYVVFKPDDKPEEIRKPHSTSHPDYEKYIIQQKLRRASHGEDE